MIMIRMTTILITFKNFPGSLGFGFRGLLGVGLGVFRQSYGVESRFRGTRFRVWASGLFFFFWRFFLGELEFPEVVPRALF